MAPPARTIVAILFLLLGVGGAKANWCGATDEENWKEFFSLFGANLSRGSDRPIVFVFGAPWCPYCAQLLAAFRSKPYGFDVRFVPKDATNQLHREQIADIVMDAGAASIVRVFEQRRAVVTSITADQQKFINTVQFSMQFAMKMRYDRPDRLMASPTTAYMTRDGLTVFVGMPNLEFINKRIVYSRDDARSARARRLLRSGVKIGRSVSGVPFAKTPNVRLRILPDETAFSGFCLKQNHGLENARLAVVDGREWLVFNPSQDYSNVTLYGLASEFFGWR